MCVRGIEFVFVSTMLLELGTVPTAWYCIFLYRIGNCSDSVVLYIFHFIPSSSFMKRKFLNSDGRNNSTKINKTNNHLSLQIIKHKRTRTSMYFIRASCIKKDVLWLCFLEVCRIINRRRPYYPPPCW